MRPLPDPRRFVAALVALAVAGALALVAPDALAQSKPSPTKFAQLKLAQGEKRIALVIGNAAYPEAPLKNPVNDARAMAQALRGRGFDVILRENATKPQMESAAADFGEKLTEGATGIFFFAGHGIQVNGRNYLIPVDARITSEQRVRLETLDVEAVVDQMSAARARVSMVILDACRNNPFERRFRSAGSGLAQISAPEGTLLAYATAPGKTAADGDGANGLYTRELLRAINTPGLKVEDVFKQVRVNVSRASNGAQVPWEASSLTGDFYFAPAVAAAPAAPPPPPVAAPTAPVQGDRELAFWDAIKTSTNPREFEAYLQQFPTGTFAPLARARLESLQAAAAPRPQPAPTPAPVAAPRPSPAPAVAPAPALAPAPAPAAPAVAALSPSTSSFVGKFNASFPAASVARGAVTLLADIGEGEIWLSSGGAVSCFGKGRLDADGTIRPFDLRCVTVIGGGGRGGGDFADQARISGRLGVVDGRTVLDLEWRGSANASGRVRGTPTGG